MSQPRRTEQQWRALMTRQRRSGLTVGTFCRRHGVAVSTFFAWRRRLSVAQVPTFVEVSPPVPAVLSSGGGIEVLLAGGCRLRVTEGFDAPLLRQVVEALS